MPDAKIYSLNEFTDIYELHDTFSDKVVWCSVEKSAPEQAKRFVWLKLDKELHAIRSEVKL